MRRIAKDEVTGAALASPLEPQPPAWVGDLFSANAAATAEVSGPIDRRVVSRHVENFTLLSAAVGDVAALSAPELADAVEALYRSLAHILNERRRHAVRVWNFVPGIDTNLDGIDRYMAFNVGRFAGYCDWFGGVNAFATGLPTSSAVGVSADALSVYVLGCSRAGIPVENPRQISSYRYSRQYGPRPPCFARATKLNTTLLIGGTASILGERTEHEGDVGAQTRETCRNIAALINSVTARTDTGGLDALRSLRVHVRESHHVPDVRAILDELVPGLPAVEFVQAALCRRELLVEIEGVAECRSASDPRSR